MRLKYLWNKGKQWLVRGLQAVDQRIKSWTQPAPDRAIKGVVSDLFRSRKDLIAENAFLRQQVIVLNRIVSKNFIQGMDLEWQLT